MKNTTRLNKQHKKTALIIFAREPKDGKVKTRLCKDLPVSTVTRLYKAFVKDVLSVTLKVKCDERFIFYVGNGFSMPFLKKAKNQFRLKRQTGKDLGERMYKAFVHCRRNHFDRVAIIGTDCVTLTTDDIEKAYQKLDVYDCVIGPSQDGGYYLIALKRPHFRLFRGIDWSTSSVLKQTLQRAKQLNQKIYLLGKREDIDTIDHLKKIAKSIKSSTTAIHTQKILRKLSSIG